MALEGKISWVTSSYWSQQHMPQEYHYKKKAGPMGGGGGPRKVGPTSNYTGTIQ
jgi:hypothetical protein